MGHKESASLCHILSQAWYMPIINYGETCACFAQFQRWLCSLLFLFRGTNSAEKLSKLLCILFRKYAPKLQKNIKQPLFSLKIFKNKSIFNRFFKIIGIKRGKSLEDSEIMPIFAPSESTTLPVEQRTRVELFLYVAIWSTTSNRSTYLHR